MNSNGICIADVTAPQLPDSGDFVYRISQPARALAAIDGVQTISFTTACTCRERIYREADVLIIHMVGDPDLLPVVIDRKRAGKLTVFEVSDNFMDFQRSNPASAFYEDPYNRACLIQLLTKCHGMQTTMPELERRFSKFNPNCRVFMNQMQSLGTTERTPGRITLGWGGSIGHLDDMRLAAPHIIQWLARHPEAHFAIMAAPAITSLFDAVPDHRKTITMPGTLQQYYDFVQTLDIGLAITRDEEFNLCRSDVKFMEYASRGVVPVCSNVPTYSRTLRNGMTGFLFSTFEEMTEILDKVISDTALLRMVAQAAFNYIRDERGEEKAAPKRLDFYKKLMATNGMSAKGPLGWVANHPGAVKSEGANHYLLSFGRVESLIYSGLISQFHNGDTESAVKYFSEAASLDRDFYPPRYYLANAISLSSPERASREYDAAINNLPSACAAPLMHARLKAGLGDFDSAIKILHRLQSKRPEFAPAWALEGDIVSDRGNADAALKLYRRAIAENSFYAPASIMAGVILLDKGDFEEATACLRKAVEIMPRSPAAQTALAAALIKTGYPDEAAERLKVAIDANPAHDDAARLFLDICKTAYKEGRYGRATENLAWLFNLRQGDAEAAFWLARALERDSGPDAAEPVWRKVIEIDTEGKFSEIARARIG